MAGLFELFLDAESYFRFRLKAPDGTVVAVSKAFDDKPAAVAGIAAVRECAGMGLITDLCPASREASVAAARPAFVPRAPEHRTPVSDTGARAKILRGTAAAPRWTGAA
jgi:uncharacterized protein YegP (UPF0339 family)